MVLLNPYNLNGRYDLWHAYPFTGSKLTTGLVFSLAACTSLSALIKTGAKRCLFDIGVLIWSLALILLLESRAPLFSLLGAFALLCYRKSLKGLFVAAILGAFVWGGLAFVIDEDSAAFIRVHERYIQTDPFDNDSFQGRVASWTNYASAALRYPLGVGFERSLYEFEFGRESYRPMPACGAHSEFLKLLVELGWGPFLFLCFLNWRALVSCAKECRVAEHESLHMVVSMLLLTLIPQLLVNNEMQHPEVSIFYWFAIGVLLRLEQSASGKSSHLLSLEHSKEPGQGTGNAILLRKPFALGTRTVRKQRTRSS